MAWGIRVFTGLLLDGLEAVVDYHGTAHRGVALEDTGLCGPRKYRGHRPRAMRFVSGAYSVDRKEWPK